MAKATVSVQNVHTPAAGSTTVNTITQSASAQPSWPYTVWAFIAVIAVAVLMCLLNRLVIKPPTFQIATGYISLAGVVAATAALERLLEPVSSFLTPAQTTTADNSVATAQQDAGDVSKPMGQVAPMVMQAAKLQAQVRANRTMIFWAIASSCGLAVSGGLGFFFLQSIATSKVNPYFDLILTGLIIGAGTKPLHDLITGIQSSSSSAAGASD